MTERYISPSFSMAEHVVRDEFWGELQEKRYNPPDFRKATGLVVQDDNLISEIQKYNAGQANGQHLPIGNRVDPRSAASDPLVKPGVVMAVDFLKVRTYLGDDYDNPKIKKYTKKSASEPTAEKMLRYDTQQMITQPSPRKTRNSRFGIGEKFEWEDGVNRGTLDYVHHAKDGRVHEIERHVVKVMIVKHDDSWIAANFDIYGDKWSRFIKPDISLGHYLRIPFIIGQGYAYSTPSYRGDRFRINGVELIGSVDEGLASKDPSKLKGLLSKLGGTMIGNEPDAERA